MKRMKFVFMALCSLLLSQIAIAELPVTSGLVIHLDASSISGANGSIVTQWSDSSGLGNHATQGTTGSQPTLVSQSTDFKGRPAVKFDGVDDFLNLPSGASCPVDVTSFTTLIVAKYDVIQFHNIISAQGSGGNDRMRMQMDAAISGTPFHWLAGTVKWKSIQSPSDTDIHVFGITSTVEGFLDGTSIATADSSAAATDVPSDFVLGAAAAGANGYLSGSIAEVVIYDRVLTAEEYAQVNDYLMLKYVLSVANPSPVDGDVNVGVADGDNVTLTLEWDGAPSEDITTLDPTVKKHYVYLNNISDPNVDQEVFEIDVTNWDTLAASYGPLSLAYDATYTWQVEEGLDLGNGTQLAGDPNNFLGSVWTFTTLPSTPLVDVLSSDTYFATGDASIELSIAASSGFPPLTYKWYKDGNAISDGADYTGVLTDSLEIVAPDIDSEGEYTCEVTASNGGVTVSDGIMVALKKKIVSYQFEGDLTDSIAANDGVLDGTVSYAANEVIALDGQEYAIVADGNASVTLPEAIYPQNGFAQGFDNTTISFWYNSSNNSTQSVLGSLNTVDSTAVILNVPYTSAGIIRLFLRDADGTFVECRAADTGIIDGNWHLITLTIVNDETGCVTAIYVDGVQAVEASTTTMEMSAWEHPITLLARNLRGTIDEKFNGMLDDFTIYNYAMADTEIAQYYYDTTGNYACILDYASAYDFSGPEGSPDCKVDIYDFASFASKWMDSGLYPIVE